MASLEDLLAPIPGEDPGGAFLRSDPAYVEIAEARKEGDTAARRDADEPRRTADHTKVIRLASDFLKSKSKDLQVVAWLTEALLRQNGFSGLREGLQLTDALLNQLWDHLHPRPDDGDFAYRAAPLGWLGTANAMIYAVQVAPLNSEGHTKLDYDECRRIPTQASTRKQETKEERQQAKTDAETRAKAKKEGKLMPEAFWSAFASTSKDWYKALVADIDGSINTLVALEQLSDRFGEDAPSYLQLKNALEKVQNVAQRLLKEKLKRDPDPVEATPSAATASAGEGVPTTGQGGSMGTATAPVDALPREPADEEDAGSRIAAAAAFLRKKDPTNPAPYLALRGLRWGELRSHRDIDPRMLAAPTTEMRTRLRDLALAQDWATLLETCETYMAGPQGRGWLDLQRYAVAACQGLGMDYVGVAIVIHGALAALLKDFPELPDQQTMDAFPAANADTRAWISDNFAIAEDGTPDFRMDVQPGPRRVAASGAFRRAQNAMQNGGPEKGIQLLMREADRASNTRERFLLESEAAQIMIDAGHDDVALQILEGLVQLIDDHKLESWEAGELVARTLALRHECTPVKKEKEALFKRICKLDPGRAVAMSGGADGDAGPETPDAPDTPPAEPDIPDDEPDIPTDA